MAAIDLTGRVLPGGEADPPGTDALDDTRRKSHGTDICTTRPRPKPSTRYSPLNRKGLAEAPSVGGSGRHLEFGGDVDPQFIGQLGAFFVGEVEDAVRLVHQRDELLRTRTGSSPLPLWHGPVLCHVECVAPVPRSSGLVAQGSLR